MLCIEILCDDKIDVILDKAISLHEHPIIWGVGKLGYKNNTEYVTVKKHKRFKLKDLLNAAN